MSIIDTLLNDAEYSEADLKGLSPKELFDKWLTWEGIIGYTSKIVSAIEDAYGIDLSEWTETYCNSTPIETPIDDRERYIGKWIQSNYVDDDYYKVVALSTCYDNSVIVARKDGWLASENDSKDFDRYFPDQRLWLVDVPNIINVLDEEPIEIHNPTFEEIDEQLELDSIPSLEDLIGDTEFEWTKCYRGALKEGMDIDEAIAFADTYIGRGEFEEDELTGYNDVCECENDRED